MSVAKLRAKKGWDDITGNAAERAKVENHAAAMDRASLFRQCFATEPGDKVLNILCEYLMQPIVTPQATQFEAGIREGKAQLVRMILAQIEFAEKG